MTAERITVLNERQKLFRETETILERLHVEAEDGHLDEIASRGDALLEAAEMERRLVRREIGYEI